MEGRVHRRHSGAVVKHWTCNVEARVHRCHSGVVVKHWTKLLVYKNFRGVNIFHVFLGAIRLLEYILLIKEQISRVSRWCVLKNHFIKNILIFLFRHCILENIDDISNSNADLLLLEAAMKSTQSTICYN